MLRHVRRAAVLAAVTAAMVLPIASPASASETEICYVAVVIDEMPYVTLPNIGGTIHVGTGEWHLEQDCIYPGPIGT